MANRKIDVNTADVNELESLSGVGHAKAEAIVDARKVSDDLVISITHVHETSTVEPLFYVFLSLFRDFSTFFFLQ